MTMFILLLAAALPLRGTEPPARIFFGDAEHPVVSGEAWLISNRWSEYPAVLVGTIREGKFEQRKNIQFPQYWEGAYYYNLLLAVSDRAVEAPSSFDTDFAYSSGHPWPEYLKHFRTVYLSAPLGGKQLIRKRDKAGIDGRALSGAAQASRPQSTVPVFDVRGEDWVTALTGLGHLTGDELVLPRPSQHTIRFLYPDGKPLAGTAVEVSLYGSNHNHCAVVLGIRLGEFVTNADGEIHVIATNSPLVFDLSYFEEVAGGPAGTGFEHGYDPIVSSEQNITVKRLWTLPEHDYVLNLRTAESRPIARTHLEGCSEPLGCVMPPSCGPLGYPKGGPEVAPESDGAGALRFRETDLRELDEITVIDAHGDKRSLTESEMRELLTTYHLNLVW